MYLCHLLPKVGSLSRGEVLAQKSLVEGDYCSHFAHYRFPEAVLILYVLLVLLKLTVRL